VYVGEGSLPPHTQADGGVGGGCTATRSMLGSFPTLPLRFHFPPWALPHVPARVLFL